VPDRYVMMQCNVGCNTADTRLVKQFDVRFEGMPNSDEAAAFARSRIGPFTNDWSAMSGWSATLSAQA
jgi:hypothetical protein